MTALAARLKARIEAQGAMPLDTYMEAALTDPDHGYYTTRAPVGAAGDFTTAPEISQMFGELLGAWVADLWWRMGAPPALNLAELGAGRGTLAADMLRAAAIQEGFSEAVRMHFVEIGGAGKIEGTWHQSVPQLLAYLDDAPLIVLANEFFDALPIRQFVKCAEGWQEVYVAVEGEKCVFHRAAPASPPFSPVQAQCLPEGLAVGDIVEACPAGERIMLSLIHI